MIHYTSDEIIALRRCISSARLVSLSEFWNYMIFIDLLKVWNYDIFKNSVFVELVPESIFIMATVNWCYTRVHHINNAVLRSRLGLECPEQIVLMSLIYPFTRSALLSFLISRSGTYTTKPESRSNYDKLF